MGKIQGSNSPETPTRPARRKAYLLSLLVFFICFAYWALILSAPGLFLELEVGILVLSFLVWFGISKMIIGPLGSLLKIYTRKRRVHSSRESYTEELEAEYFVHEEEEELSGGPRIHFAKRASQVVIATFGLASYTFALYVSYLSSIQVALSSAITSSLPQSPLWNQFVAAFGLLVLFLVLLPFVFFPVWIYEDVGLRHYHRGAATASVPGEELKEFVSVVGAILSIVALLSLPSTGLYDVVAFLLGTATFLLPPCFLASAFFFYEREPKILIAFLETKIMKNMKRGHVHLATKVAISTEEIPPPPPPQDE
ncbi:MAG: hypothetical protein JRN15_03330 [Nitrososphaerota archaeon]|nr:hypothetical protein [Nitrososphaerota archaeon]